MRTPGDTTRAAWSWGGSSGGALRPTTTAALSKQAASGLMCHQTPPAGPPRPLTRAQARPMLRVGQAFPTRRSGWPVGQRRRSQPRWHPGEGRCSGPWSRHPRGVLRRTGGVLLRLAVAVGACGSTATGVETYTDPAYGYSFEYPADWKLKIFEVTAETIPDSGGTLPRRARGERCRRARPRRAVAADMYMDLAE